MGLRAEGQMRRIRRVAVLVGVLATAACNGFPDAIPISEAEHMPEKYTSYKNSDPTPVISAGGQRFMVLSGSSFNGPATMFESLATGGGGELFVLRSDRAPYDALYARSSDGRVRVAAELR